MPTTPTSPGPTAGAVRHFARFQLLRLLGRSAQTMVWLVADPRSGADAIVVLPRQPLRSAEEAQRWLVSARRIARVEHPSLAPPLEVGEHDRWPYLVYARGTAVTLAERLGGSGLPAAELAPTLVQALDGLAFAHQSGTVHRDLQAAMLLLHGSGCRVLGLGLLHDDATTPVALRQAVERDVLAVGVLLHQGLTGRVPFDLPDVGQVIARLPPQGHDFVRLPHVTPQPVPAPLRAIANRATDRQERQRYRNARSLAKALEGWLSANAERGGGPMTLLVDRVRAGGVLPAGPGGTARAASLASMDTKRLDQLAEVVLHDLGLSLELLRLVNSAGVRGAMGVDNGPILTVRRAIAMLGLDGVRRAARVLKPWPGTLPEGHEAVMERQLELARQAGRVARWLRPAGYDGELALLLGMLQRLGRLVAHYHFPEEAAQIRRLMAEAGTAAGREDGLTEQAASFAVLGIDIEQLGQALLQNWGLDEQAQLMMRRLPAGAPVHATTRDADLLRYTASCANELVDAWQAAPGDRMHAVHHIAQRYGRVLRLGENELLEAMTSAPSGADRHPAQASDEEVGDGGGVSDQPGADAPGAQARQVAEEG